MEFLNFLKTEAKGIDKRLLFSGVVAGVINTLLIFILTAAAHRAAEGRTEFRTLALVVVCLVAFWMSKGYLMRRMATVIEAIVETIRIRVAEKVRHSDLASIESIGSAPLYNVVSMHAGILSRAATVIVSGATSVVLLICAFFVIYLLSSAAFLILIATLGLIILMLMTNQRRIVAGLSGCAVADNAFVSGFEGLVKGFKELKMNSVKNHEFYRTELEPAAGYARELRTETTLILNRSVLLASASLFIMLSAVVFLLPVFSPDQAEKLVRITTLIVFIFGPLGEVVAAYPMFTEAEASIREINRVEGRLDEMQRAGLADPVGESVEPMEFSKLRCEKLEFSYRDERGEPSFSLEPLHFELARGELVFITGGNGSGKSTFLKVLAGLYFPASGDILVNDVKIGPVNRQSYRNLFATIFPDFHLFDRVYGVPDLDENRVKELLTLTDLAHKTSIVDGRISATNLSSGQRKRLALVLALLEDKPVILLDEWAAEQDPPFRRKFYREILPWLKNEGRTIVAITHDDDSYDVADRVLKMQAGNFSDEAVAAA